MRRRPSHRLGALLLLATQLAACTEWHVEAAPPQAYLESRHPSRVRVTRTDSTRVVLDHPSILGDSLTGERRGRPTSIAVADVTSIAIRRTSVLPTVLLVGGGLLVIVGAAAAASSLQGVGLGCGCGD